MSNFTSKITIPIILVGCFSIAVFIALNYSQLGLSFYIILLLLTIYIFSFGFAIGQNLASPVKKLLAKATELSRGNLSSRVYLQTKDELSELANILNKIAEELEESHIDGKMIERSADIKVRARTQVLEETIGALEQKVKNRTIEMEKLANELDNIREQTEVKETEITQLKKEIGGLSSKFKEGKTKKSSKKNKKSINSLE